jgi:hypothetical protein
LKTFAERSVSILQQQTFKIPSRSRSRHLFCGIKPLAIRSRFVGTPSISTAPSGSCGTRADLVPDELLAHVSARSLR